MLMSAVAIILLVINVLLMLFFFLKIRARFSYEKQQAMMRDMMNSILKEFNLQTDQAVTILEEKIQEMKKLILDSDKRFIALSRKLEASHVQDERIKQYESGRLIEKKEVDTIEGKSEVDLNKDELKTKVAQESVNAFVYKGSVDMAQNDKILKAKVVEMYKNGWSIDFIADKLSIPREEVRLMAFMAN